MLLSSSVQKRKKKLDSFISRFLLNYCLSVCMSACLCLYVYLPVSVCLYACLSIIGIKRPRIFFSLVTRAGTIIRKIDPAPRSTHFHTPPPPTHTHTQPRRGRGRQTIVPGVELCLGTVIGGKNAPVSGAREITGGDKRPVE